MKSRINKTEYTFEKYPRGNLFWYKNGLHHREKDLPAIIYHDGDMYWYKNGKYHRENDLPAIIYSGGDMEWYINGKYIRYTEDK